MSDGVSVDVVILSWNRLDSTVAAIESALDQPGVSRRIIVVDQGSDGTNLARLRSFVADRPAVTLEELPRNVGVAAGRNLATGLGSAPYVVVLDNDARFARPDILARTVQRFDAEADLGAIAFRIVNAFTLADEFVAVGDVDQESWTILFGGAGHAIRRRAFEMAGGYDGAFFFAGEERDLAYRLLNVGYRIRYVPELRVWHRAEDEGRLHWRDGRYYYVVRNRLYTHYKLGASSAVLLLYAAAAVIKGVRNGLGRETLRAVADASAMAIRYSRCAERDRYRLSATTKADIRACERMIQGSGWRQWRRPFAALPHLGRTPSTAQPPR